MQRKNLLLHSLQVIAQIRIATASHKPRWKLDEGRLMCDEQLVAHGLWETRGDSEVDAPVPRLSTATTGYQRLSSSRISWQAPCLAHWNLFVNRGRALLEHAPAAKLDPYFSTSATSTTPVGWVTSPAIVDLSYTGGSTLKPTTFSVTWRPVLAWIPSRLSGRRTNRRT